MTVASETPRTESPNQITDRWNDRIDIVSFPPNLGTTGDEPYMLIKIFETVAGAYTSQDSGDAAIRQGLAAAVDAVTTSTGAAAAAALNGRSKMDIVFAALATTGGGQDFLNSVLQAAFNDPANSNRNYVNEAKLDIKNFSMKRNEAPIRAVIGLFMPEALQSNYNQNYESLSMTQSLGTFGFISQAYNSKSVKDTPNPFLMEGVSKFLSQTTGMNETAQKIMTYASTGMTINPQLEMIYTSPNFREFQLDYKFYPKSVDEAKILFGNLDQPVSSGDHAAASNISRLGILGALKYFSAPRIPTADANDGGGAAYGGRYFIPPAQFQLEFYNNKTLNKSLFKTKNCVLSGISVDYTPNGFSTHEDGVPVEVRVQLTFKETVMLNRSDIDNGF